jgi:hypothetical protein
MSVANDTSRFWPRLPMLFAGIINGPPGRFNRWPVRACLRALVSFPVGAMANSLSNLSGTDNARLVDLGIAGLSAASLVLLLRWIGRDHGIAYAIKLTFLSWLFVQSLVVAVQTVWIASGMNGTPEPGFVWVLGGIALALFIPTSLLLRKLDPD